MSSETKQTKLCPRRSQMGTYILPTLLPRVKRAIDAHHGLSAKDASYGRPWPSCAIVRPLPPAAIPAEASLGSVGAALGQVGGLSPFPSFTTLVLPPKRGRTGFGERPNAGLGSSVLCSRCLTEPTKRPVWLRSGGQ